MLEKQYRRQGYAPDLTEIDNISAVTNILLETVKVGRPAAYEDSPAGLEAFKLRTIEYLEHVQRVNESDDMEKKVVVDIESWSCFAGITRATLSTYERTRGEDWQQFIAFVKNGIASVKKEAAFHGQIQPMIAVFDLANNHSYINTNEFKLKVDKEEPQQPQRTPEEIAALYGQTRAAELPDNTMSLELPPIPD